MKAVMFYDTGSTPIEKFREAFPRHKKIVDQYAVDGKIIAIGTFSNISDGSMGIFKSREYAEEFIKHDPFVIEGLVQKVIIRDWNESLLP
jgi:uncharacterized protein YciI